jgi:hypothetical protein
LKDITPSGSNGRYKKDDIEAAISQKGKTKTGPKSKKDTTKSEPEDESEAEAAESEAEAAESEAEAAESEAEE